MCLTVNINMRNSYIHSDAQKQVQQILTGEQYQKWEELKKQQQEQQKK